jgi:nucleoside-diphosphate-sugar epimerase
MADRESDYFRSRPGISIVFQMKRVLVTGASGFIGSQSLPHLIRRGYEVHAVAHGNLPQKQNGIHWYRADFLNSQIVNDILTKVAPSHLLHFAWYAEPGKYQQSEKNSQWYKAGIELLHDFAASGGRRAVFAGTCFEYALSYGYCSEASTPCVPVTPYGTSKLALAQLVAGSPPEGVSTAWGRVFHLYGPGEHPSRLVPSVVCSLLRNEPAQCTHGRQVRDFMHVEDVASAFVALLDSGVEGILNIGSGQPVSIRTIALTIAELIGAPELVAFGAIAAPRNDPAVLIPDVGRLQHEVGWRPQWSLHEGIASTIRWWKANEAARRLSKAET